MLCPLGCPFEPPQAKGFYKGMSMPVTTVSLSSSVVFGTYRNILQILGQLRHRSVDVRPAKLDIFLSGLAGGVAQVWNGIPL